MTTKAPREPSNSGADALPAAVLGEPELDTILDQTLHTRDDFWIQIVPGGPDGSGGVYLSTFQGGSAQHVTTLTADEARSLGKRLIDLAKERDAAA